MTPDPDVLIEPVLPDGILDRLAANQLIGTNSGTGDPRDLLKWIAYWRTIGPRINRVERTLIAERVRLERIVADLGVDWSITGPDMSHQAYLFGEIGYGPVCTLHPVSMLTNGGHQWATQRGYWGGDHRHHMSITDALIYRRDTR